MPNTTDIYNPLPVLEPAPQGMGAAKRSTARQSTSRKPVKNAKSGHKTRKIINYSNVFAKMKKSKFLVRGMLGMIFFRAPRLRAVPALRSSLLQYSKGFALLPFKNGVKIAAIEGVAPSIDHHPVPGGRGCPCRGPGTGGGVLEPTRDVRGSQNRVFDENHSVFWSKFMALPDHGFLAENVCVTHFITRSSR